MSKTLTNKQSTSFRRTLIATAVASTMLGATSFAMAQDESVDEVVVTGIKASLQRAMDIKRDAKGVVDAISAEDMGKFPDTNLAESLQRISGVSIDRQNGEGSKVTVRGFGSDYNLVTLNGRQMPIAEVADTYAVSTRSFDFGNLASEGVSGVEVYKTGRADLFTGGIGSTINILTPRPLASPGLKASVGVKGVYDDSANNPDLTPEISGIYSNTFADDTIGVSLTGSFQERKSGSSNATTGGWYAFSGSAICCDWSGAPGVPEQTWGGLPSNDPNVINRPEATDIFGRPQKIEYSFSENERTRTNGQLVLQYKPVDSVTTTLDYTYSELESERRYNNLSAWFDWGRTPASAQYPSVWTDGPISSPLLYNELSGLEDFGMGAGLSSSKTENDSVGLNVEWLVTDNLTLEFDGHNSKAESSPNGGRFGSSTNFGARASIRAGTVVDFSKAFPAMKILYPAGEVLTYEDMQGAGHSFRSSYMMTEIDQYQIKGTYEFDDSLIKSIDFGLASTEMDYRSAFSNVQNDTWGGTGTGYAADVWGPLTTIKDKFDLPGSNAAWMQNEFFMFDLETAVNAVGQKTGSATPTKAFPCGKVLCAVPYDQYGTAPATDRTTNEESESAYVQVHLAQDIASMPANLIVGVRYEATDVTSTAMVPVFVGSRWGGANEIGLEANDEVTETAYKGDYDYVLPNVDFDISPIDSLVVRASYSETIARPTYDQIQGGLLINAGARPAGATANRGNPKLLPYESKNIDLSAEWYYADTSYVSLGYFRKDVDNFIGTQTEVSTIAGVPNPADGPRYDAAIAALGQTASWASIIAHMKANGPANGVNAAGDIIGIPGVDSDFMLTTTFPVNEKSAQLDGWEFAVQHVFGESGFGFSTNATVVDGDVDYNNLALPSETQFALIGLSDSANLIGFYEKFGWSVRLAYNWRDDFLSGTRHDIGDGGVANSPIYVEDFGQWDLNVSYEVNDQLSVFFEGINLTDEYSRTYGREWHQVINVTQLGPRYNIGARYTF